MKSALVVDYGAGNIGSISNFLNYFEFKVEVENDPGKIVDADLLVLPGVGSFGPAKSILDSTGASEAIIERSKLNMPIFGVCLGFQLLTLSSEESEGTMGLGLLDAITKRLEHGPMIGWQKTVPSRHSSEFSAAYYFNHAFGIIANCESEDVTFSNENLYLAFMRIGNLIGTQFHPEKSQRAGYDFFSQAITKYWPKLK